MVPRVKLHGQDLAVRLSTLGFYEVPKISSADGVVFICLVTIIKEDKERMRKATTSGGKFCHLCFMDIILTLDI